MVWKKIDKWRAARVAVGLASIIVGLVLFWFVATRGLTLVQLVLASGWFLFAVSSLFYNSLLDMGNLERLRSEIGHLAKNEAMMQKMHQVLEQVYGYHEELAKDTRIYSQLLEKGVGVRFANSMATFAQSVEPTDTIFLIRIDNKDRQWYFNMAGLPVYDSTAKWLFDTLSARCGEWASVSGMVVKGGKAVN